MSQLDVLKTFELSFDSFRDIKKYCDKKHIIFLSTPHSFDAIDFLDQLVPIFKFGSGDLTNIPALTYAANKGKPMILGTGMATLEEVKKAIIAIKNTGNNDIVALHCTTNYPCPINEVNMNAMKTMIKELDCMIGYSDHTLGPIVPIMAVSLGAVVVEKHFTLDRDLPGPDHRASLEPDELKEMIIDIRNVEKALGSYDKKPTGSELIIMKNVRKSIVANRDIKQGELMTDEMLAMKRPGTGISPANLSEIIGKRSRKNIKKDELVTMEDFE